MESAAESGRGLAAIEERVARRVDREPMAYILGRAPFRSLEVAVDERVLWPRRETELLVEVGADLPEGARVHEVGTGSGDRPGPAGRASRPQGHRLGPLAGSGRSGARERRAARHPARGQRRHGIPEGLEGVDLVIANLPYVTDSTIFERSPEIQKEPRIAVTGDCGEDGLGVIRGLIAETPSGWKLAMEHDTHHGPAMREMLRDATTLQDYEGDERVTVGFAP